MEVKFGELSLDWIIGGFECQQKDLSRVLLAPVTGSRRRHCRDDVAGAWGSCLSICSSLIPGNPGLVCFLAPGMPAAS